MVNTGLIALCIVLAFATMYFFGMFDRILDFFRQSSPNVFQIVALVIVCLFLYSVIIIILYVSFVLCQKYIGPYIF
jgi:hypothetical protein